MRDVKRTSVQECWCGGELDTFQYHSSYGVCTNCGTYVNKRPPAVDDLEKIYTLDRYWRVRQKSKNIPEIDQRSKLYRESGRIDKWMDLIKHYGPPSGKAIEIGCAPGVLLEDLTQLGYDCTGVEISQDVTLWLTENTNLDIRAGFFLGVDLPHCDMFLSFDVLEHSPDPYAFMAEAYRLLKPGGIAIIQTAIERYDYTPPFGRRFDLFDDLEHLFLFTHASSVDLFKSVGFDIINDQAGIGLGGEICILKRPTSKNKAHA
jgi:SAM-dependent methyltransferase